MVGERRGRILAQCMKSRILLTGDMLDRLLEIEDIESILSLSSKLGIKKGTLTEEKLQILLSASKTNLPETIQVETRNEPIGRVIAP